MDHYSLGFCVLDIIAALILICVVGWGAYRRKKLKDKINEVQEGTQQ